MVGYGRVGYGVGVWVWGRVGRVGLGMVWYGRARVGVVLGQGQGRVG